MRVSDIPMRLNFRQLWHFIGLVLVLSACQAVGRPEVESPALTELQVLVASDDFAVGRPRIPLVIFDGPQRAADLTAVTITAFDLSQDPPARRWSGEATGFSDYEVPYRTIYPEIDRPGFWGFEAAITRADGRPVVAQFALEIAEAYRYPSAGEAAIASQNRTLATGPDLARLSSDREPLPALYEMTIADALTSGRPTVVMFATPAYCQTAVCAPAVESLKQVYTAYQEQTNFIQVEIFADFQALTVDETVRQWGLTTEPWTYVIDAAGLIVARFGGPVSPREIEDALAPLLP